MGEDRVLGTRLEGNHVTDAQVAGRDDVEDDGASDGDRRGHRWARHHVDRMAKRRQESAESGSGQADRDHDQEQRVDEESDGTHQRRSPPARGRAVTPQGATARWCSQYADYGLFAVCSASNVNVAVVFWFWRPLPVAIGSVNR